MTQRINGTITDMKTIGSYQPIAGLGMNTIRKMSSKYADLSIGDQVEMIYQDTIDSDDQNGVERLVVSSLAMVPYGALFNDAIMHLEMNHGRWNSEDEFNDFMEQCYGAISEDDAFLVVYF